MGRVPIPSNESVSRETGVSGSGRRLVCIIGDSVAAEKPPAWPEGQAGKANGGEETRGTSSSAIEYGLTAVE